MADQQYDVTIMQGSRRIERVSTHLDVEGDQVVLRTKLRQLILDAVERAGWRRDQAHLFTLTARRPGWSRDAFEPYVIPREEVR